MQDDRELSISCPFHLSGDEEEPVRVVTDGNHEIVSGLLLDLFIQKAYVLLESQSERDWKLRMEGTTFSAGKKLNVTGFDELKAYIWKELGKEN